MTESPHKLLSPRSCPVSTLLSKSIFEIPKNQREYRWGADARNNQCLKLWDDLVDTVRNDCAPDASQIFGHFLGQIVVIGEEDSSDFHRLEVIDGQQRLTTITILCACVRPYLEHLTDKRAKERYTHIIRDCIYSSSADAPRIKLNRDDEFYRNSLLECDSHDARLLYWRDNYDSSKEVQKNIRSAFELFNTKICDYLGAPGENTDFEDKLVSLVSILTSNLYFLVVRCENPWLVYRLFETLNERGMDLSQADLIKNVLLENSRSKGVAKIQTVFDKWEEFLNSYEMQSEKKLDLPHLIQFSYSYRNRLVKKEDIFDTISQQLRSGKLDPDRLVAEFAADSANWNRFLLGDLTSWSEALEDAQFAILDPLWKKHCVPYIMAVMDKYSTNSELLLKYVQLCEDYLFRQGLICKDGATKLQRVFSEASVLIRVDRDINDVVQFFRENSPDHIFVEEFKTASLDYLKQGFYAIWKIEKHLAIPMGDEFRPKTQSSSQHLEHIMPRSPGEGWAHVSEREEYPLYVNRIGNFLVLESRINQSIKNKKLDFKVRSGTDADYANSRLALPAEFVASYSKWLSNGQWDLQSINLRQEYLARKYALDVWPLQV